MNKIDEIRARLLALETWPVKPSPIAAREAYLEDVPLLLRALELAVIERIRSSFPYMTDEWKSKAADDYIGRFLKQAAAELDQSGET